MEGKLKTRNEYDKVNQARDTTALLGLIRDIAHDHMDNKNKVMASIESDLAIYMCAQGPKQTNADYAQHFRAQVKTVMAHRGKP